MMWAPFDRAISFVRSRESVSTVRIWMSRPARATRTSSRTAPIEASSFIVGTTTETSTIAAPCWQIRISVSRSRRERLPEKLVADVAEHRGAQSEHGPERRLAPEHLSRPIAAPEGAVLQGELLAARAVPQGLPQEVVHGVARPMVDDRARAEGDRVACANRTEIEVDILRGHEPGIEAADRLEHRLAVGEVRGRKRDIGPRDNQLDPLEFLERPVADLDRPARDDVMGAEALAKLLHPERIRDRVAVDERDRLSARLANPEVATRPARASL